MGIFIFGMNPRKETLIYVYRYIGNAKLWFLKPDDTIHFLLYENLQFSKKMNQKLLFYQKACIVWFKNHDFTLPMYLHKHGLWRLFSCFHTENENPFRMWSNEALRWMFKSQNHPSNYWIIKYYLALLSMLLCFWAIKVMYFVVPKESKKWEGICLCLQ